MDNDQISIILSKYLSGESTIKENEIVENWLTSTENKILFEEYKEVWAKSSLKEKHFDENAAWELVSARTNITPEPDVRTVTTSNFNKLLKIAATLLIAVGLSYFAYEQFYNTLDKTTDLAEQGNSLFEGFATNRGEIKKFELDDGTLITLNSGSRLEILEVKNERLVRLNGEAFFDVFHDKSNPFVIESGSARIKVLGTKFNVTAWDNSNEIIVAVSEGKVMLNSKGNVTDPVYISKGEVSTLSNDKILLKPQKVDVEKHFLFWLNDELNFYNASFKKVINRLELKYDVDVKVSDLSILSKNLTARFKDESLENILKSIAMALDLDYSVEERNQIIFNYKDHP